MQKELGAELGRGSRATKPVLQPLPAAPLVPAARHWSPLGLGINGICLLFPLEICWQLVVWMAGRKNSQPKVNLKKFPLRRAAEPGRELRRWRRASPEQEQGYLRPGDARCLRGCRNSSGAEAGGVSAALCRCGSVPSSVFEAGSRPAAPSAAQLRCGVKPPPRERSWERDVVSAKIPKAARQTSPRGFSPWGSLCQKALFFQRGRTRLSLSAGALEIVSRWALEKRGSPGCESLWKPPSELFCCSLPNFSCNSLLKSLTVSETRTRICHIMSTAESSFSIKNQ